MMNYLKTDDQTINDLAIFGEPGTKSVFDLYNKTQTAGGSRRLAELFRKPLTDEQAINRRAEHYRFFSRQGFDFPVETGAVGAMAYYIDNDDVRTQLRPEEKTFRQKVKDTVAADSNRVFVEDGVRAFVDIFSELEIFLEKLSPHISNSPYEKQYNLFTQILGDEAFAPVKKMVSKTNDANKANLKTAAIAELDKCIRFEQSELTLEMLDMLYELDVYIAIGKVARTKGFHFSKALPSQQNRLSIKQVWHPFVEGAVANDLEMNAEQNLTFLTGANMAGKSTLMKAISVALYLAHIGLPVAAEAMEFSVRDGLYTNINLPDNLQAGISHFYAEVLRVKEVAQLLQRGEKLFVVFDELFRGTNVKDAYDGTVAIARGFSHKKGSQFIISTHIMEAGQQLAEEDLDIQYVYLPTRMEDGVPVYPRVLQEGITDDRKGMAIINNEGILELLDAGIEKHSGQVRELKKEPLPQD